MSKVMADLKTASATVLRSRSRRLSQANNGLSDAEAILTAGKEYHADTALKAALKDGENVFYTMMGELKFS